MRRKDLNHVGRNVRDAIDRTGMTYAEFCAFAGISSHWLHTLINASDEPLWAENLRKIARATDRTTDSFLMKV